MDTYYDLIDGELKYIISNCPGILKQNTIQYKNQDAGFYLFSQKDSFFFPGKCLLQLYIKDTFLKYQREIWDTIVKDNKLTKAIVNTEDNNSLGVIFDHQKDIKPIALGFLQCENINNVQIPGGLAILQAKPDDTESILDIWNRIFAYYKMNPEKNTDELKRTEIQIHNNDVWYLQDNKSIIGFGVANFTYCTNKYVEIGFAVNPAYWRKGYAVLLAKFLILKCLEQGKQAIAHCHLFHEASIGTLEKAGMAAKHRKYEILL